MRTPRTGGAEGGGVDEEQAARSNAAAAQKMRGTVTRLHCRIWDRIPGVEYRAVIYSTQAMPDFRLGDVIDDFCVKCRRVTNHSIVSLMNGDAAKVRCRTCYS